VKYINGFQTDEWRPVIRGRKPNLSLTTQFGGPTRSPRRSRAGPNRSLRFASDPTG
jgi:hypothetical protein